MPFGQYKGKPFDEVPDDYIQWLFKNVDLRPPLSIYVLRRLSQQRSPETEIHRRHQPDLRALRRRFSAKYHPDRKGGCRNAMTAVNELIDELESNQ
ncbi:hypothetical protein FYK55_21880 [Roseiconus nitratireducens]|uniref:J domain-containing protein n=1 Tax=Roseiconus nitratireducens TaxID=2605748 RepID=A0A5M6D3H8_9BACT|nr:DUF3820 family protein [Roseiconus nitratireducens]KAA5540279.1 hypothetical protein FYK55_21880 [Roseiconus nitratireducens]